MKYLIFSDESSASARSEQIAIGQGCDGDVTKYWFGWIVNYTDQTQAALCIPPDGDSLLTPSEQLQLKDQAYMEANGWFPPPII